MPAITEPRWQWRFTHPDGDEALTMTFVNEENFEKWRPWFEAFERFLAAEKAVRAANAAAKEPQ